MAEMKSIGIPPRVKDLTGKRFGRLVVVSFSHIDQRHNAMWTCQCDCGSTTVVVSGNLTRGHSRSCGCLQREMVAARLTTHGNANFPEYNVWWHMLHRCQSTADARYLRYGGRGIEVCERWQNSFEAFFADMGPKPAGHRISIERIDNEGHYEPCNCVWATPKQQARNRSSNVVLTFEGRKQCLADWASEFGLSTRTLRSRLNRLGWPLELALRTPVHAATCPIRRE